MRCLNLVTEGPHEKYRESGDFVSNFRPLR